MTDRPKHSPQKSESRPRAAKKRRWRIRPWRLLIVMTVIFSLAGAGLVTGFVFGAMRDLPSIEEVETLFTPESSFIYDRYDQLITEIHGAENRISVSIDDIPEHVKNAFIAIEDERFYRHFGVDLQGLARAAINNLMGRPIQGGSTITQQLARNLFPVKIGRERRIERKIQEAIMAIRLERRYTKDQILEMYLNQIFLGDRNHNAYGIEAAARVHFNKSVKDLTIAEAALLAGINKGPHLYSPRINPEAALQRRNLTINAMERLGYITPEEAEAARQEPLQLAESKSYDKYEYPYFVDYVLQQLLRHFTEVYRQRGADPDEARQEAARTVYGGGLHIYTTLDPAVQRLAEQAVAEVMDSSFPMSPDDPNPIQAATVTLDNETGAILAMVGGRKHETMLDLNRAWQTTRQPGSAIKPIVVYAPALANGMTPGTVVDDAPVTISIRGSAPYSPKNYDLRYSGLMTLRDALRNSRNVPAVTTLMSVGIETAVDFAQRLGISTLDTDPSDGVSDLNPSLALGGLTRGTTVLELAEAFATFANMGIHSEPYAIRKVVDRYNTTVFETRPQQEPVMEPETAWLLTDMLRNVIYPHRIGRAGTGSRAALEGGRPAAGKTGTTDDYYDVWFVGYTAQLTTAVWLGHDEPKEMRGKTTSGTHPVYIWKRIMDGAHAALELPVLDFPEPDNIVKVRICKQAGLLPGPYCPPSEQYTEVFVRGTEPTETEDIWQLYTVCEDNPQLLYQPGCSCRPVEKVFLNRPRPAGEGTTDDMSLAAPTQTCEVRAAPDNQGGQRATIVIHPDSFEPMVIWSFARDRDSEPFLLTVSAPETAATFAIPDLDVRVQLGAGDTARIELWPSSPGTYSIEVTVDNRTMHGRLVVRGRSGDSDTGNAGDDEDNDDDDDDDNSGDEPDED